MSAARTSEVRRKIVAFDEGTWRTLDLLARDSMKSFQELADEAFRDLLRKHGRPDDLRTALRQSAGRSAEVHRLDMARNRPRRPRRR